MINISYYCSLKEKEINFCFEDFNKPCRYLKNGECKYLDKEYNGEYIFDSQSMINALKKSPMHSVLIYDEVREISKQKK